MFEQKLIVGRYIDLVLPPIAPPAYARNRRIGDTRNRG
jgi:hypothetical protein